MRVGQALGLYCLLLLLGPIWQFCLVLFQTGICTGTGSGVYSVTLLCDGNAFKYVGIYSAIYFVILSVGIVSEMDDSLQHSFVRKLLVATEVIAVLGVLLTPLVAWLWLYIPPGVNYVP